MFRDLDLRSRSKSIGKRRVTLCLQPGPRCRSSLGSRPGTRSGAATCMLCVLCSSLSTAFQIDLSLHGSPHEYP